MYFICFFSFHRIYRTYIDTIQKRCKNIRINKCCDCTYVCSCVYKPCFSLTLSLFFFFFHFFCTESERVRKTIPFETVQYGETFTNETFDIYGIDLPKGIDFFFFTKLYYRIHYTFIFIKI